MEEYLGILIEKNKDRTCIMSKPQLIDRIIKSIPSMEDPREAKEPAKSGIILTKDLNGKTRRNHRDYRSVIRILQYVVNCTHPELALSVRQCTRFCIDPKYSHGQVIKRIVRYLLNISRDREGKM